MNHTTVNPPATFLVQLTSKIATSVISGPRFVSITYTSKGTGEVATHVINLGASYENCIRNSKKELELLIPTLVNPIEIQAANELVSSFDNTLTNMQLGLKNDQYTKKDTYNEVVPGLKVNLNDETFEIQGLEVSKSVIQEGTYKKVNSSALTIAKNKLRKLLPCGMFRSFTLDKGHLDSIRIGGTELVA